MEVPCVGFWASSPVKKASYVEHGTAATTMYGIAAWREHPLEPRYAGPLHIRSLGFTKSDIQAAALESGLRAATTSSAITCLPGFDYDARHVSESLFSTVRMREALWRFRFDHHARRGSALNVNVASRSTSCGLQIVLCGAKSEFASHLYRIESSSPRSARI